MSSSSNRRRTEKVTTGFDQREISGLMSQGAGMSIGNIGGNVSTPEQQTRVDVTARRKSSTGLFGIGGSTQTVRTTQGFQGLMSNMNQEDVQRLADSVRRRRSVIQEQMARPGRRQLMAGS